MQVPGSVRTAECTPVWFAANLHRFDFAKKASICYALPQVSGRILEVEALVQSEATRKRTKMVAHLPLTGEYHYSREHVSKEPSSPLLLCSGLGWQHLTTVPLSQCDELSHPSMPDGALDRLSILQILSRSQRLEFLPMQKHLTCLWSRSLVR